MSIPESRYAIRVTGTVQGVGFRPFVANLAATMGLTGHVGNDPAGVFIEIEGPADQLDAFIVRLSTDAPALSVIEDVNVEEVDPQASDEFEILASRQREGRTSIPPDTAVCEDCLSEMRDPEDRRFGFPFIACTHCGPRFTITTGLPYDREHTTMVDFPMCADCEAEYVDPASRRYHAQPTACPECGPQLSMPVAEVVSRLHSGEIIAIKGIGGYHLCCDARNEAAVARLRERKQRGSKPFAVMAADVAQTRSIVHVEREAEKLLLSPARPIVLLPSRDQTLQESVSPGNALVGVMLPYAPVHHLLFDASAPRLLVMTSGNLSDEPICTDSFAAEDHLASIADAFCHHDRRIQVACDDSVLRVVDDHVQPVRRSRGFAPMPVRLPIDSPPLLAVGGELKAAAGLAAGSHAWLSQHIGDTENLETLAMLERCVDLLQSLLRIEPQAIVSDAHPGYLSRQWAEQRALREGVPHITVQHHHAHLASLLAEHRWPVDVPVLGFCFDGSGYGGDGTIWGGELLLGGFTGVARVGHLAPIALPGGDAATRHPARTALAHLHAAGLPAEGTASRDALGAGARIVETMLTSGSHCTPTTSMGRLFDAIASLLDLRHEVDYEGQAAIELESLATATPMTTDAWTPEVRVERDTVILDPLRPLSAAVAARRAGAPLAESTRGFHLGLAEGIVTAARAVRDRSGVATVGLTGGVFANSLLTRASQGRLEAAGFQVLVHHLVPPNDGGLALGQLAVAAATR